MGSARSNREWSSRWQKYWVWKSSGRQTTWAPRPAASAVRSRAFWRFCSGSGPQDIWTRATRNLSGGTRSPPANNIAFGGWASAFGLRLQLRFVESPPSRKERDSEGPSAVGRRLDKPGSLVSLGMTWSGEGDTWSGERDTRSGEGDDRDWRELRRAYF